MKLCILLVLCLWQVYLFRLYFRLYLLLQVCCPVQTLKCACPQISVGEFVMTNMRQHYKIWDLISSVLLIRWIITQCLGLAVVPGLSLRNPGLSTHCCLETVKQISQLEQSPALTCSYGIQFSSYFNCCLFVCQCITLHCVVHWSYDSSHVFF